MQVGRMRLAIIGATVSLLASAAPGSAQADKGAIDPVFMEKMMLLHGRDVFFGITPQNPSGTQRYLYTPWLGAFTIGPDKNFAGMNPLESMLRQSVVLPQADPTYLGASIPYTSGAINQFDVNRALIDKGMRDAAPDAFRHPNVFRPWYSLDDSQVCAAAAGNAWTFSADVIAPEVEAFRAYLPNQKVSTDVLVLGSTKPDFNINIPSAFGSIYIKDGAKALVCRSQEMLRVFNLTGKKDSVIVKFPSGRVMTIGPGSELVATRQRELLMTHPKDGIWRRGASQVIKTQDIMVVVNEFHAVSVLRATGLNRALATAGDTAEKRLCNSVIKSSAILATMRGAGGFTDGTRDRNAIIAQRNAWLMARNRNRASAGQTAGTNPPKQELVLTSARSSEPPVKATPRKPMTRKAFDRCVSLIRKPLTVMRGNSKATD